MNIENIFNIRKKVVILTGATGLLGTKFTEGLSCAGANVVIADKSYEKCSLLKKK